LRNLVKVTPDLGKPQIRFCEESKFFINILFKEENDMLTRQKILIGVSLIVILLIGATGIMFAEGQKEVSEPAKIVENAEGIMTEQELIDKFGPVPKPSQEFRIGAVVKTLMGEHWQEVARGYQEAAEKYGVTVDVQGGTSEQDLTGQLAIAETMVMKGYDILLLSPITKANLNPAVEKAIKQGIPIINVDFELLPDKYPHVYVGWTDHRLMGKWAAEYFDKNLPPGSKVAHIEGLGGALAAEQRKEGFLNEVANTDLNLVASQPGNWDRKLAYDVATNIMKVHPDLRGIYCANDGMALGVVEAVMAAGKEDQVMVFGTDGIPDAIESIRNGKLTGTVAQFAYHTGRIGLETAIRILEGQQVSQTVLSKVEVVTVGNVNELFPQ
jgi:ribose transport system substrate-binding protein